MIKYIGKITNTCEMCNKWTTHTYLNIFSYKKMFPEMDFKDMKICEKCAKRESPKKQWNKVRRKL